jgi:hypothetical protein
VVSRRVTKRRKEARLGTGMHIVDKSSPQIEVMGKRVRISFLILRWCAKTRRSRGESVERKIAVYVGSGVPLIELIDAVHD